MDAKIRELVLKNEQALRQLYALNKTNDELKEKNQLLQQSKQATIVDEAYTCFDQRFTERLLQSKAIPKNVIDTLMANFQGLDTTGKEKFLFDVKFYVVDSEVLEELPFDNFVLFLDLVTRLLIH